MCPRAAGPEGPLMTGSGPGFLILPMLEAIGKLFGTRGCKEDTISIGESVGDGDRASGGRWRPGCFDGLDGASSAVSDVLE